MTTPKVWKHICWKTFSQSPSRTNRFPQVVTTSDQGQRFLGAGCIMLIFLSVPQQLYAATHLNFLGFVGSSSSSSPRNDDAFREADLRSRSVARFAGWWEGSEREPPLHLLSALPKKELPRNSCNLHISWGSSTDAEVQDYISLRFTQKALCPEESHHYWELFQDVVKNQIDREPGMTMEEV